MFWLAYAIHVYVLWRLSTCSLHNVRCWDYRNQYIIVTIILLLHLRLRCCCDCLAGRGYCTYTWFAYCQWRMWSRWWYIILMCNIHHMRYVIRNNVIYHLDWSDTSHSWCIIHRMLYIVCYTSYVTGLIVYHHQAREQVVTKESGREWLRKDCCGHRKCVERFRAEHRIMLWRRR